MAKVQATHKDQLMWWVDEALQDPFFAQLCKIDMAFRPYAAAATSLRHISQYPPAERRDFFRELATKPRAGMLTELSGIEVRPGALRLLAKTDYEFFEVADWRALLISSTDQALRRELHKLEQISPLLVRQLGVIPASAQCAAVLNVLNTLVVSKEHWQQLEHSLNEGPEGKRKLLAQQAKKAHSTGLFWDYFFACSQGAWKLFDLPASFFASPLLRPLATAKEMKDEGLSMRNCLGQKIPEVLTGREAYFHWNGTVPASVQLARSNRGWSVGQIRAARNKKVNADEATGIIQAANAIIAQAPNAGEGDHDRFAVLIESLQTHARQLFDSSIIQRIEAKNGYIQFMADREGEEYLCEIQSHHFVPEMEARLIDPVVSLISECGFRWPEGEQNFARCFPTPTDADVEKLAEFALGILSRVLDYAPGRRLKLALHLANSA